MGSSDSFNVYWVPFFAYAVKSMRKILFEEFVFIPWPGEKAVDVLLIPPGNIVAPHQFGFSNVEFTGSQKSYKRKIVMTSLIVIHITYSLSKLYVDSLLLRV